MLAGLKADSRKLSRVLESFISNSGDKNGENRRVNGQIREWSYKYAYSNNAGKASSTFDTKRRPPGLPQAAPNFPSLQFARGNEMDDIIVVTLDIPSILTVRSPL